MTSPWHSLDRRNLLLGLAAGGAFAAAGYARGQGAEALSGQAFELTVDHLLVNITGRRRLAVGVNGSTPAPLLRWREGDTVEVKVINRLDEPTSIHWHGLRLPTDMDGTPGLSFAGIPPHSEFTYRFPVTQHGTYWYHSHSGAQEPLGLFGPIVIAPKAGEAHAHDREHVVMLSDWSDEDPMAIIGALRQQPDYYNHHQRTLGDLGGDVGRNGLSSALAERAMWAKMRMSPTDILDASGDTFTYLVNGRTAAGNWTGLFEPGERVRLRIINAGVGTIFDLRIPGLPMTVVGSDGADLEAVTVDEIRMGPGETYDVIVQPREARPYTLFAQTMDRTGFARATLAPHPGMAGAIPAMDAVPRRSMADMGMGMQMGSDEDAGPESLAGMDRPPPVEPPPSKTRLVNVDGATAQSLKGLPDVDNVAVNPASRLAEPGTGLEGNGRKVLTYADMKSLTAEAPRAPDRELEFHITGNMQRWTWGFDGKTFSQARPVPVTLGERIRFVLINDTMMEHPMHLHGFIFEVENGQAASPRKHTLTVKPGERVSVIFDADTPGRWAFHCHLLYHMHMGMFRTVVVS
jgi:CopA family copper-resistance protein